MSETVTFKFGRGDHVKHIMTKYDGIVVMCGIWFSGCARYHIQSTKLKDGKLHGENFDEGELELIKARKHEPAELGIAKPPGGPQRGESSAMVRR